MSAAAQSIDPRPRGVVQTALSWHLMPMLGYFFAKNLVRDRRDLRRLFWTIAVLGAFSGAYAVYERVTGNVLFLSKGKSVEEMDLYRSSNIRMIRGIWGGTGIIGRALALSIPVTFYLWLESPRGKIGRLILLVMLGCEAIGLVVAMSRTPWYATLIALFIMQFFYPKFRRVFLVILLFALILIWATWDQVAESQVAARVSDRVSTLEGRQARWTAGYHMWLARPIRGWGFGQYAERSGRFRQDGLRRNIIAVENDYLYMLVGAGLMAFVPYALYLLTPLFQSIRLFTKMGSPEWRDLPRHGVDGAQRAFLHRETLAVYWAVLAIFCICSFTALVTSSGLKLITFTVVGGVVGSHEQVLRTLTGDKGEQRRRSVAADTALGPKLDGPHRSPASS
jgi:O-antigen ligase